ncbi:MAG: sensor histidine kinase [Bacteroidia bacterium]
MNRKIPSSILISLYLALGITGLHAIWSSLFGDNIPGLYRFLAFFLICFTAFVIILEWLVFRKLKNLRLISQREIKKLKELEAYRREFLGEVSHELKTPIFAIQGFIDTLIDGAMDDEKVRVKFLKKAGKNANRLASLVDDLLLLTQAESGEMEIKIRAFSMYELLIDVLDSLNQKYQKKSRPVAFSLQPNELEDTWVLADQERIQQVLINLIDNGVKYGDDKGAVNIMLKIEDGQLITSIEDDGPGIDQEHIDKIFRRFYRVDKSRSRDKGGTGLGLAIVKHFLEAHGSQISVVSQKGKGTTFSFPLKIAEKA